MFLLFVSIYCASYSCVENRLSNSEDIEQKIETERKGLAKLNKAIANLLDTIELHPSTDLIKRLNAREIERDDIQNELDNLYHHLNKKNVSIETDTIINMLTDMKQTLSGGEINTRKMVIKKMVSTIEIGRDVAKIHYQFPLYNLYLERVRRFELLTSTLGRLRSTTELYPQQ